ncbi:MAG: signal peptidase I [Acidobacteriales bacterium]|nr:signal peptidase I [Terriglobales bacterium]
MEFIGSTSAVLVVGLFIITFIFQNFEIPSASMVRTLLVGDHVVVDRITFAPRTNWAPFVRYRPIQHGDIFVFLSVTEPGLHIVKRVMGVPGDRIHLRNGVVYRNGEALNEPYITHQGYNAYRDDFPSRPASDDWSNNVTPEWRLSMPMHVENGDLVVPPDSYFAMGDNRDNSLDSRYWGFVPADHVVGRPMVVYWSFETPENQWQQTGIADRVGFLIHTVFHFFDQTRWSRTLHLVR